MSEHDTSVNCEEIRELVKESPEQAAVIIEMLKAAGEECAEVDTEQHTGVTEH